MVKIGLKVKRFLNFLTLILNGLKILNRFFTLLKKPFLKPGFKSLKKPPF